MAAPDVHKSGVRVAPLTPKIRRNQAKHRLGPDSGPSITGRGASHKSAQNPARHKRPAWSKAETQIFLGELERSCNVALACRKIGRPERTAYAMRQRDSAFAAGWAAAIDCGYAHLESRLLQIAMAQVSPPGECDGENGDGDGNGDGENGTGYEAPKSDNFDTALALRLIATYQKKLAHMPPPQPVRMASDAETDAIIIKHLKALHNRLMAAQMRQAKDTPTGAVAQPLPAETRHTGIGHG